MDEIQNEVIKTNIQITNINNEIDKIKNKQEQLDIEIQNNLEQHRIMVVDKVERIHQDSIDINFPASRRILKFKDNILELNKNIKELEKQIHKYNKSYNDVNKDINEQIGKKSILTKELKVYEDKIRDITCKTNILKQPQIDSLFDVKYDEMNMKLNKLQHRKQNLIHNNNLLSKRKKIRDKMRIIDKQIKMTYWKMVHFEIEKNNRMKSLIAQYQIAQQNIKINNEMYKFIDIPVHQIMSQNIHNQFKKQIENINQSDVNNQLEVHRNDINKLLKTYQETLNELEKLNDNSHKSRIEIDDVNQIYNKYRQIQHDLELLDQNLLLENQKSQMLHQEIKDIDDQLKKLVDEKILLQNCIDNFNNEIKTDIDKEIDDKMSKYAIKMDIKRRHQNSTYQNQLENLANQKLRLEAKLAELYNYIDSRQTEIL